MKATRIVLALVLPVLAGAPLAAQSAGQGGTGQPAEKAATPADKQARQMYEDVAVFRLLLNRTARQAYGLPADAVATTGWAHHPHGHDAHALTAEGVYVKGSGVVYNLSAPPPAGDPMARGEPAAGEPSPWERARQELLGDKPAATKRPAARDASLSEALLRLLAENGRHFSQLGDDETVTVAVTFRGNLDCARCHQAVQWRTLRGALGGNRPATVVYPTQIDVKTRTFQAGHVQYADVAGPALNTDVQSSALLGDTLMKQKRYPEAIRAYRDALQKHATTIAPKERRGQADVQRLLAAVEINNKLAQAHLAAGDKENAERSMAQNLRFVEEAVNLARGLKAAPAAKATMRLPSKLIVAAPKKLLDQAGAGKVTPAEFRKQATIEHLTFPAPGGTDPKKEE